MQQKFTDWYASEIAKQLDESSEDTLEPVDLSTARMKCIGANWLIQMHDYLVDNPQHVVKGFVLAGIAQSIDAGEPVVDRDESEDENDDYTSDNESTDDSDVNDSLSNAESSD